MTAPDSPQQLLARVNRLAGQKQIIKALSAVKDIHIKHPDFAPAWLTGAFLYFQNNQVNEARHAIQKARKLEPDNALFAFQEMMMLDTLNHPAEALTIAQELVHNPMPDNRLNHQLAQFLEVNFAFEEAKIIYEHLKKSEPNNSRWLLKLAMIEQNFGRLNQAAELAQQALKINPDDADVLIFLSHLHKQTDSDNHINTLQKLSDNPRMSVNSRAKIYFALAKELEDCQHYAKSFKARKKGADLYRSGFQYDVNEDLSFMRQLRHSYNTSFIFDKPDNTLGQQAIFIVGLPRSGTTLLDRIISSHSEVTAAGELKHFNRTMLHALQQNNHGRQLSRNEMVKATTQLDFEQLGKTYLNNAQTSCGHTARFTDKLPLNSLNVGLILKALPKASIIIMKRHPISVCYAVYKQLFYGQAYPYSYQLEELADYYIEHDILLSHWQQVGDGRIQTIYYEDLVQDLETQTRAVLSFLDLPWQDQCLEFHKNKQAVATASASQVRQKVYTDSVTMWQNYETELQPLISKLKAAGCLDDI